MKFQATAPRSAASTTIWVTAAVSTIPFPRVDATSVEMSAPSTFATAAMPRAIPGRSARVEMEVAIAFAESWKPLVKSKRRAVATTTRSRVPVKHLSRGRKPRGRWHKAVTSANHEPPGGALDEDGDRRACEGEQGARANQGDGLEQAHAPLTCNG